MISESAQHLTLPIPLVRMRNGNFDVPEPTSQIMFDVGLSFNAPNSIGFLKRNPDSYVVAFEPNPHHYLGYYSAVDFSENPWLFSNLTWSSFLERRKRKKNKYLRNSPVTRDTREFLPRELRDRFALLPVAITEQNFEEVDLYLSDHAGSSSLDSAWPEVQLGGGVSRALGMRLDYFIDMIPQRFQWITHLKVDTEGFDSKVIASASNRLSRFIFVSVEEKVEQTLLEPHGFVFFSKQKGSTTYVNRNYEGSVEDLDVFLRV